MGFTCLSGNKDAINVTHSGIDELVKKAENELQKPGCSCLVVAISSHGEMKDGQHYIVCCRPKNNDRSKETLYKTSNLIEHIASISKEKPKIFFIEACRGTGVDQGVDNPGGQDTSSGSYSQDNGDQMMFVPNCPPHCVVAFSCPSGMDSYNSLVDGGWLLHEFDEAVKMFSKEERNLDILTLLTYANDRMSARDTDKAKKCIGSFQHKLVKNLVLEFRPINH